MATRPHRPGELFSSAYLNLFLAGLTSPDAELQQAALRALLALAVRAPEAQQSILVTHSMLETVLGMAFMKPQQVRHQALQLLNVLAVNPLCVRYLCQSNEFKAVLALARIFSDEKRDYVAAERALQIINALLEAASLSPDQVEAAKKLISPMVRCTSEAVAAHARNTLDMCERHAESHPARSLVRALTSMSPFKPPQPGSSKEGGWFGWGKERGGDARGDCNKCGRLAMLGEVSVEDGSFYCGRCWESYEAYLDSGGSQDSADRR